MLHAIESARASHTFRLSRRVVAMVGVLACAAAVGGCSSTSTTSAPSSPAAPHTTTITSSVLAAPSNTPGVAAPSDTQDIPSQAPNPGAPTATVSTQPPTVAPTTTTYPTRQYPLAGTPIAGEGLTGQQEVGLQQSVDSGHQPWRLDRVQVAKSFVQARFGWSNVQTSPGEAMDLFVTDQDSGARVSLHLTQPATRGAHGIWVIDSGAWA